MKGERELRPSHFQTEKRWGCALCLRDKGRKKRTQLEYMTWSGITGLHPTCFAPIFSLPKIKVTCGKSVGHQV